MGTCFMGRGFPIRIGDTKQVTATAAGWEGAEAPYTQTLNVAEVVSSPFNINLIAPDTTITAAQLTALQEANIQDGGQGVGTITLKAFGIKPTIDLPLRVTVLGV